MSERYYFIGIGGIGMSGLARILLAKGAQVSGSDIVASPITDALGAEIAIGHDARNIALPMTVIYSSGIGPDNPEYQEALRLGCRMLHRSELLAELMQGYKSLAVTGTHGKTTTTALLGWVLFHAGLDPSIAVGGVVPQFQSNSRHGEGDYFVAEADESDGSFLRYAPHGAIVTNIGLDHMDHYHTEAALLEAFRTFVWQVENRELLFWCGDDTRLHQLAVPGVTYGFGEKSRLRITRFEQTGWTSKLDLDFDGRLFHDVETSMIGRYNALNTVAVFGMAWRLGIDIATIREAVKTFKGVGRRAELKGEAQGTLFYDDYAHHPTEIHAVLGALRHALPDRRLIAVFQPHRYSRTKACLGSYGALFNEVDELLLTDIYPAGERPLPGVSAEAILDEVQAHSSVTATFFPRDRLVGALVERVRQGDLVVTLGAGDVTKVGPAAMQSLGVKTS